MRKIINPWLNKEGYNCFGCAPNNPIGLHMEFFEEGDDVICFWRPQEHYQGWIGVLHGGIISTLIDETAGWVVTRKLQTAGLTSRLSVNFRKSLSASEPQITVRAHIAEHKRNFVTIQVTVENAKNEVCAEGEAVYFALGEEKSREMGFMTCEVERETMLPF